ncbi:2-hydroxyacid dehydrogenase, partial [Oscillatoria laete-virens NRMC-F 0139]|nr:2-hydroxyacid dehydrogenase [Oscillatoria laete-virens NRMC-F 0139]
MKTAVFSSKPYDREFLTAANAGKHDLHFLEPRLTDETAAMVAGFSAVCVFVHDRVTQGVLEEMKKSGGRLLALRCAGFNNVDLKAAAALGISIARVPAYSPYAVAEHAVGLLMTLNRRLHRAYNRVREGNFSLDGLMGFDLHGKTVGVIGTGKIGQCFTDIMLGFGCRVIAHDPFENDELKKRGVAYVSLDRLFAESDVISLHCPLTEGTRHLVGWDALARMKTGVVIINTSRGALVDA